MADQAAEPNKGNKESKFKTVLLLLIVILVVGVGSAFYLMMPPKAPELKAYQWPPEAESSLAVSTTLGDNSAMLMTQVRFLTNPIDLETQLEETEGELNEKRSIIDNVLTEVGNSLDSESSLDSEEFKRRVKKMLNDELTHCEIDKVLIKDWIILNGG